MRPDEIRARLSAAIRSDSRAAAILKKIAAGRANFSDTMEYSLISGRLTGRQLSAVVTELAEGREELAEALLRDRCEDINAKCAAVQTALDEKQGVHLAPRKAAFPTERAATFAHSLTDPTVSDETIKRRARNVSENITVTFHDDFIEENARFRDRAGLKCYVTRSTSGNCCPWCSGIAGRYLMSEQPEGLFGRHDNCDCTIVYDGQVLRGQPGENGRRGRKWAEDKPKVEYTPPKRFSHDEAEKLQAGKMPKRLTGGANGGIIENEERTVWLPKGKRISKEEFTELRSYAESRGIKLTNFKNSDVDVSVIKEELDEAKAIVDIFPELLGDAKKGLTLNLSDYMNDDDFAQILDGQPHIIDLNANAFRDKELLHKEYGKKVVDKWFVQGTDYRSIIVHELGHRYQHVHNISDYEIVEIALKAGGFSSRNELFDFLKDNLSIYSSEYKDGSEIISEVFSDFFTNKVPLDFSRNFMAELKKQR